jgi:hypothetical protein
MLLPRKNILLIHVIIILFIMSMIPSCRKDERSAKITLAFRHLVGADSLLKDNLKYINTAGNLYEVNELQYFVSEIILWNDGEGHPVADDNAIHYVDIDIPSTLYWSPSGEFPTGEYDSVTFIFGINEEKNKSGLFVNPPERNMFWPDLMGGGYHYIKINGKWIDSQNTSMPFNLHMGIGMIMDSLGNNSFVQNYFKVSLPLESCSLNSDRSNQFEVSMNINSWFDTPEIWDWDVIGGQIMQNQQAMAMAARNGKDAFKVRFTSSGSY